MAHCVRKRNIRQEKPGNYDGHKIDVYVQIKRIQLPPAQVPHFGGTQVYLALRGCAAQMSCFFTRNP